MAATITYATAADLRVGDRFAHRGRTYVMASGCWTDAVDARGEYVRFPAFSDATGRMVWITVRDTNR